MEFCPSSGRILQSATAQDPSVTKAFKVYNFVVSRGGEIELSDLAKHPSPLSTLDETQVCEWLKDFSEQTQGDQQPEKPCFSLQTDSNGRIVVRICLRVKLCSTYEKTGFCSRKNDCLQWHVCRGYLDGNSCTNDKLCPLSHNLLDEQNIKKAQTFRLEKHSTPSIRKVLAKNLPFVCEPYATNNGRCSKRFCEELHLCPNFVKGDCAKNEFECPLRLSHNVDFGKNKAIFMRFGIPPKYFLAHVLLPKITSDLKKGKVNNLNNLNTETEAYKMVHENVPLNIDQDAKKSAKNRKQGPKREEKAEMKTESTMQKQERSKQMRVPQLMDQNISSPLRYPGVRAPFPSLPPNRFPHSTNVGHQRNFESQTRQNEFAKKIPKGKNERNTFGSKENLARSENGVRNNGDNAAQLSGAKPKRPQQKKFDERRSSDSANNQPEEFDNLKDIALSGEDEKPQKKRGGRRRQRQRKQGSQDDMADSATQEAETDEVDLIQFGKDDFLADEEKLIDLNFDNSDPSLSQMSEGHSKAMWDLFSQDMLYSLGDNSLSQPAEAFSLPDPLQETDDATQPDQIKNASQKGIFNCLIMEYGGTATFSDISTNVNLWDPRFKEQGHWFRSHKASFLLVEDSSGNIEEVKAVSHQARMCFKYNGNTPCTQENCSYFHVCKEYIINGRCSNYHGSCNKYHTFKDSHNQEVASRIFPENQFDNRQLRQLILSSTPQVCMDYNNRCCYRGKRCTKVHICKNYGHRRCPNQCKLAHENALKQQFTKDLLARFRIHLNPKIKPYMFAKTLLVEIEGRNSNAAVGKSTEVVEKESKKTETKVPKTDSTKYHVKTAADLTNPICLAFLMGQCDQGSKCHDHHCSLPYQWVYMSGSNDWKMVDPKENGDIEKLYCEDNISDMAGVISMKLDLSSKPELSHMHNVPYIYNIDFKTMHIGSLDNEELNIPLKRLSTPSDVLIPECSLATTWCWYWKNEHDLYVEYQPRKGSKEPTSKAIERFYQEGMSRYNFSVGRNDYRLYFNDMCQKNMDVQFLTKREVIRRPQFVSRKDFNQLKRTFKMPEMSASQIPSNWKKMTESQTFLLKKLNTKSKEFKNIESLFVNSMGGREVTINSVNRVQNPFMWEKYKRKKDQMLKRSESKNLDERQLFHGTSHTNIRSICKENFDWRLYGDVTGNKYGEGAYFARDASFSHCYCNDDEDGIRYVFIAKVLVGSYTKGEKNYRRPPPKNPDDPDSDRYDSCVDRVDNPQVFAMFDVDQFYPEYVIEYACQGMDHANNPSSSNLASYPATIGPNVSMTTPSPNYGPYPDPYHSGQAAAMASHNSVRYSPSPSTIGQTVSRPTSQGVYSRSASMPTSTSSNVSSHHLSSNASSTSVDVSLSNLPPIAQDVARHTVDLWSSRAVNVPDNRPKKVDNCAVM